MIPKYLDFLNQPAEQEYFTKFNAILSRDTSGNSVAVDLHRKNWKEKLLDGNILYCDKILIGETLESAISRSLLDDFGLELIDYDLLVFLIDTEKNKLGQSVTRFPVVAYVEYSQLKNAFVVGYDATWIDSNLDYRDLEFPEALGWLKKNSAIDLLGSAQVVKKVDILAFVENLYTAGALDIAIGDINHIQEPPDLEEDWQPNFVEIRLPKDSQKRKIIFNMVDSGIVNATKNKLDIDSGQSTIKYYWA